MDLRNLFGIWSGFGRAAVEQTALGGAVNPPVLRAINPAPALSGRCEANAFDRTAVEQAVLGHRAAEEQAVRGCWSTQHRLFQAGAAPAEKNHDLANGRTAQTQS
jgi:hypothetical protein